MAVIVGPDRLLRVVLCVACGVAALLTLLLRQDFVAAGPNPKTGKITSVHGYCFAPPPIMDEALAQSPVTRSLLTSIVYQNDLIPHISLASMLHLKQQISDAFKVVNGTHAALNKSGGGGSGSGGARKWEILSHAWNRRHKEIWSGDSSPPSEDSFALITGSLDFGDDKQRRLLSAAVGGGGEAGSGGTGGSRRLLLVEPDETNNNSGADSSVPITVTIRDPNPTPPPLVAVGSTGSSGSGSGGGAVSSGDVKLDMLPASTAGAAPLRINNKLVRPSPLSHAVVFRRPVLI